MNIPKSSTPEIKKIQPRPHIAAKEEMNNYCKPKSLLTNNAFGK